MVELAADLGVSIASIVFMHLGGIIQDQEGNRRELTIEDYGVFDVDGNLLGLSMTVGKEKERWFIPAQRAPEGATSRAWDAYKAEV